MAKRRRALHVRNLDKYLPAYTDRAYAWFKVYCRDVYDQKNHQTYRSIIDDPDLATLDEINRWRFFSLIAREANLGRPVPMEEREFNIMRWDLEKCSKSRTVRMLHKLVEVCYTSCGKEPQPAKRSEEEEEEKAKRKRKSAEKGKGADAPAFAEWLAPDFPLRFASVSLRSLIVPQSKGDETTLRQVGEWLQEQVRAGADPKGIAKAILERAAEARHARKPIALFLTLLQRDLGYPVK